MTERPEPERLPSSEEMLRSASSEALVKEAREALMSSLPDTEVPDLETEVEVEVDFDGIADAEPEPRIETTFRPTRRRSTPGAIDPATPQPHERTGAGRGLIVAIALWIALLGIAIAVIAALAVEAP